MSLNSALNASVSGLRAQGAAISAVSENIANASTTAYKTRGISFQSLVTGNQTSQGISSGGVLFDTYQNINRFRVNLLSTERTDATIEFASTKSKKWHVILIHMTEMNCVTSNLLRLRQTQAQPKIE